MSALPHTTTPGHDPIPAYVLHRALMIACERIADGPQSYHEANTPDGWYEVLVQAARGNKSVDQVLAEQPPLKMMTDAERRELGIMPQPTN